jgi:DNA-binding response OmpR family regulator
MAGNPGTRPGTRNGEARTPIAGHVLHISDDRVLGSIGAYTLRQIGLEVTLAASVADALAKREQGTFDLAVIDPCDPALDAIHLVRELRSQAVNPILLLTEHHDEAYSLRAYEAGVDECIVKPISPSLFLAKVRSWLRRTWTVPAQALESLKAGPFCLDPVARAIILDGGATLRLTNLEFRLMHLLMSHPGQPLPADVIIDRVWGYSAGDSNLLKNVVYRLRRKIEPDPARPRYLRAGAGSGYVFTP